MAKHSNKIKEQFLNNTLELMLKGYSQGRIALELDISANAHSQRLRDWYNTSYTELKKVIDTGKSKQEIFDSVLKDNHHARLMQEARRNKELMTSGASSDRYGVGLADASAFIPPEPVEPDDLLVIVTTLNDLMWHRIQKLEERITQLEKANKKSIFKWWRK